MLLLEIEFLSGVCYAASERAASVPEYPPQADRIYSALIAAWAARGQDERERAALEWLERQDPPKITASPFHARSSVDIFVPPNDGQTGRTGNIHLLPARRRRQPRRFPAAVPIDPTMRVEWTAEPEAVTLELLCALAADMVYVGHSASLVRAQFCRSSVTAVDGSLTRRSPYAGRLAELERAFHLGERAGRGQVILPDVVPDDTTRVTGSIFARNWIVLPGITEDRFVPDTRATAIVAKRMRDALMSSFGDAGQVPPSWISGHEPDGSPARSAHLAIVPMLDVGHPYASGALMGIALVPPTVVLNAEEALIGALLRLQLTDVDIPQMRLQFQSFGKPVEWRLSFTDDDARSSLNADRYISKRGARRWASVTPIVLDHHLHAKGAEAQTEIESLVATSVQRIGLPAPSLVFASKHPAHEGVTSAYPSGNAPAWTRWSVPASLATRPLTHAVIEFSRRVHGPVLIGAGRFVGFGLFLPLVEGGLNADN